MICLQKIQYKMLNISHFSQNYSELKLFLLVIMFSCLSAFPQNVKANPEKDMDVHEWISEHFAKGKIPPFSFYFGGRSSNDFIHKWQYHFEKIESAEPNAEKSVFTYSDKQSGLVVKCTVTGFSDFPVVEWVINFSNLSASDAPVIEKAAVIDYLFTYNHGGSFILHHANGSNAQPGDFMPIDDSLQIGKTIKMMPAGARGSSDNTAFPFFNIESPSNKGVMVAVGWTGQWYADVQQTNEKTVLLKSGMARMKISLHPGEEIRTPKICLLFWKGKDRMVGHNQFRQFVLTHHTRKLNGQFADLPLSSGVSRGGPSPCAEFSCLNESYAIATVERFKQFDLIPEVCWIDAGWYTGGGGLWVNVGDWTPDKERFPRGLKPVSDAIHSIGSKFLLWFEPERVVDGSPLSVEHPDWLLRMPEKEVNDYTKKQDLLLNLGNQEARLWLTGYISDFLKKEGVDYYRQDFNWIDGESHWKINDRPDREGITEIRYIEGLYAFWDSLLVRFPGLLIDNCASGGRRIDLETISRSSPLWRSDYGYGEPDGYQNHTYGLNFYLPLHGTGLFNSSMYDFRSSFSSSLVLLWDIHGSGSSIPAMQKCMRDYKSLRPYCYGDYYPLTGTKNLLRDDVWLAYQLNRPDQEDGIIMAFRRKNCPDKSIVVKLRGIDINADYELLDKDSGEKVIRKGIELNDGIILSLAEKKMSLLVGYKRVNDLQHSIIRKQ